MHVLLEIKILKGLSLIAPKCMYLDALIHLPFKNGGLGTDRRLGKGAWEKNGFQVI